VTKKIYTGILRTNPRGFGFVQLQNSKLPDIFISKANIAKAIDGDTVEIQLLPGLKFKDKGPEGKVVKVVKRERKLLAATVEYKKDASYRLFSPLLGMEKILSLTTTKHDLQVGDRIIIKIHAKTDVVSFVKTIGSINDPSIDVTAAIAEFDIQEKFSKKAIIEAKEYGSTVTPEDKTGREDFTKLHCITIDPDTAKDFDDAISLTQDDDGHYHLGVHIADVAHYIHPDTALDADAYLRGNSTYFPGTVAPMLPHELSSHLCSLKPNVTRLCASVLMDFDTNGNIYNYRICRSYIKSKKRLTYKEALTLLDSNKKTKIVHQLKLMKKLALHLKNQRFDRGSIDFALPEAKVIVDDEGNPQGIEIIPYDITHQMIEEFMLKANEITALHLSKTGKMLIYRVHEEPNEEDFTDFIATARALGFTMPPTPNHHDFQQLFLEAKTSPHHHRLSISFIRTMRLAQYSPDNIGHYGLSLEHYCHFTSPIRRYSDLIAQRLLFHEAIPKKDLTSIADTCSSRERISFGAETSVIQIKKLRLLQQYHSEDKNKVYSAKVTKIKPYFIYFEIKECMLEGSLHISELLDDYYIFDDDSLMLKGENTGVQYHIGKTISVLISSIDLIHQQVKWKVQLKSNLKKRRKAWKKRTRR
jgi:ribonuclease R